MLVHLIKKDILLAKKLAFVTMLMVIAIPLFIGRIAPALPGFFSFFYMLIMTEIVLLQNISVLEAKSPKVPAFLCATPYTRKTLVRAKYVFFILLFAYCYVVHTLESLITNPSNILDLTSILMVLLFGVSIYGIYMPIEFKYGVIKARFVFMVVILGLSLGPTMFANLLAEIDYARLSESMAAISVTVTCSVLALLSVLFFSISMTISMRIFANKEL